MATILNGYYFKEDQVAMNDSGKKSTALITHDFLGGSSVSSKVHDSQELDLDIEVPNGWEKILDLKSGKVYVQTSNSLNSSKSSYSSNQTNQTVANSQDLNFFPSSLTSPSSSPSSLSSSRLPLNLFDETSLDLKLVPSSSPAHNYQSACTLDKVKFALERAERTTLTTKRSSLSQSSSSSISNSCSVKNRYDEKQNRYGGNARLLDSSSGLLYAAGCTNCLLYVMVSKTNPRCPRCNSLIPSPKAKKPRINLNIPM